MCYRPRKVDCLTINYLIKIDYSSINYSGENEGILTQLAIAY